MWFNCDGGVCVTACLYVFLSVFLCDFLSSRPLARLAGWLAVCLCLISYISQQISITLPYWTFICQLLKWSAHGQSMFSPNVLHVWTKTLQCAMKRSFISRQTKLRMFRALVSSVLLYGSETWNLTTRDCNRLNTFDMSCLRQVEIVKWYRHVRNIIVRQQTKPRPVSHPKVKCWNYITYPRPQSAGRLRWLDCLIQDLAVIDLPSQRQFISLMVASAGVSFFVVWPLCGVTSKSFKSSQVNKEICSVDGESWSDFAQMVAFVVAPPLT